MSYPEIWEDSDRSYLDLYLLAQVKQNTVKKKENKQMHKQSSSQSYESTPESEWAQTWCKLPIPLSGSP